MKTILCALALMSVGTAFSQSITNGNFNSTTGWGCSPEFNAETVYGGSNGSNKVTEIDAGANICQTITGFTIGSQYVLSLKSSRRTGGGCPSPNPTTINVQLGTVINTTLSRSNTTFGFTTTNYSFTANATSMTLSLNAPSMGTTCGMIVDDIALTMVSPLPVTLLSFEAAEAADRTIDIFWKTASEEHAKDFEIQFSADGKSWERIALEEATGSLSSGADYLVHYTDRVSEVLYFRLIQRDIDGTERDYGIRSVKRNIELQIAYPNPFSAWLGISGVNEQPVIRTALGTDVSASCLFIYSSAGVKVDTQSLAPGVYLVSVGKKTFRVVKQ